MTDKRKRNKEANRKNQEDYVKRHRDAGRRKKSYYSDDEGHEKLKKLEQELIDDRSGLEQATKRLGAALSSLASREK